MKTFKQRNPTSGRGPAAYAPLLLLSALFLPALVQAQGVDWGQVEGKTVKVFYPGVASWDFVKHQNHGSGAAVVKKMSKACAECHVGQAGEYDIDAEQIVSGALKTSATKQPLEPEPIAGMPGFKDVEVKIAYDADNIHVRFQWPGSGASVADPALAKAGRADAISVQISTKIGSFGKYGCFIACHDDQAGMPADSGADTKLYAYYARAEGAARPQDKLDEHLSKGQFIDLWVASFEGAAVKATDEHILHDRLVDDNNLSVGGGFADGTYTVVITRPLSTGDTGDLALQDGSTFDIGIAIHDGGNKGRKHYVSFPVSIGLANPATVTAKKL